jgi:hypothetical protein
MQQLELKRFEKHKRSAELAEYMLLLLDLQSSMAAIKIWHEKYADDPKSQENQIVSTSLFRDAIVQFVGCFDKSAKFRLKPEEIYRDDDGALSYFQWLNDVRNAYAAHKFGALRQMVVGVFVDPQKGVVGTGHLGGIYAGPVKEAGPQMLAFMAIAKAHLEQKIQALSEELIKFAKTLSLEQLNALKTARVYGVDPHEVSKSRPAIRHLRAKKRTTSTS